MSIKIYVKYVKNNRDFHTTKLNLPTGSLDERNRDYVLEILQELNYQGKTIVVVTHDPHVNECAQRHIMLKANHTLHDLKNRECTMLNSKVSRACQRSR